MGGQGYPSSLDQRPDKVKQFGSPGKKQSRRRKESLWQENKLGVPEDQPERGNVAIE